MCGIVGKVGGELNGLETAVRKISHRGPDDVGLFLEKKYSVGLAHCRLSILDTSPMGHQPMLGCDGKVALVFNGELYNFRELRDELKAAGFSFKGNSDTEVLLNLYLLYGRDMLPRLNGIFTFAIWDERRKEVFIARDALGVKPLYYMKTKNSFFFFFEIKGLLCLAPEARELDEVSLHRYLNFLWCPGEGTPLKSVRKLLPGEAMVLGPNLVKDRWSWYKLPVFSGDREYVKNKNEAVKNTLKYLRQAVKRQLVADVPVGAFLSGGLDSSSIVALAREELSSINCFTINLVGGNDTGFVDDLPYANKVARHLNVPLTTIDVDSTTMAYDLEKMIIQLDEPLADPAPLNVQYISKLARESGIKVLLSGVGGDDLFSGYRRHSALTFDPLWSWLPSNFKKMLASTSSTLEQHNSGFRRLARLFRDAELSGDEKLISYFLWANKSKQYQLYTQEYLERLAGVRTEQPMLDFLDKIPAKTSSMSKMLALEQRFFLSDHNLIYTDKMSMAEGVEVRVPFLDLDLISFSQKIPSSFKQRGAESKWVLKKAMEPFLPRDVIYRSKSGFGAPIRRWFRNELKSLLRDTLSVDSLRKRGIFDPHRVQELISENEKGKVDSTYTLLSLLSIELWCKNYIDQVNSEIKLVV